MSFSDAKSVNWLRGPAEQNPPPPSVGGVKWGVEGGGKGWGGEMGKGVRERSFTFVKFPGGLQKRMRGMNTVVLLAFNPSSLFQFQCTPTASRKHPPPLHSQPGICPTVFGAGSATLGSWFLITALPTLHWMVCLLEGQRPILCNSASCTAQSGVRF